jgi:hypothetical protein
MLAHAAFKLAQLKTLGVEHVRVRRHGDGLADTLRSYGQHHRRRATAARWELGSTHSVVVPCYGHDPFLEEAIESITRQDWRPLEIVAVNDASPDESQTVLQRLSRRMPDGIDMRLIRVPWRSAGFAIHSAQGSRASGDPLRARGHPQEPDRRQYVPFRLHLPAHGVAGGTRI